MAAAPSVSPGCTIGQLWRKRGFTCERSAAALSDFAPLGNCFSSRGARLAFKHSSLQPRGNSRLAPPAPTGTTHCCSSSRPTEIGSHSHLRNLFRASFCPPWQKLGRGKSLSYRRSYVETSFSPEFHVQTLRGGISEGRSKAFGGPLSIRRIDALSFSGYSVGGLLEDGEQLGVSSAIRSRRRIVTKAAAASATVPSPGSSNWWAAFWSNFPAVTESFAAQLQRIRIGWLDLLTMMRIIILATGALAAYIASRRTWHKIREYASSGASDAKGEAGGGGGGEGGPMQMLARGLTCVQKNVGPWSLSDMALGLTAMAKVTEKEPPVVPGREVKDLSHDSSFLLQAQHWRSLSEAAYVKDSASFSLFSSLPESSLVAASWEAEASKEALRPAYAVFVDAPCGSVVLAVRGTSHVIDMLVNSGASPEPFGDDGYVHAGFLHATEILYKEVLPQIEKAFNDHVGNQKDLKLVIIGHSMGAAVASLMGLKLREKFSDLQCWCFCPPACMSLDLAKECKSFTTSFVAAHDVVPRFSIHAVERLRTRIQDYNWDEVERVAKDDEDWQNMKKALEMFRSFQQSQAKFTEKLKASGVDGSEISRKATNMGDKIMNSEATGKLQQMGKQANDFIEGKNENLKEKDGSDEEETSLEDMPSLHPPGRLFLLASNPPGCGKLPESRSDVNPGRNYGAYPNFDEAKKVTWRMLETQQEEIDDIVVSPWCLSDHMLGNLCEGIGYLQSCCPAAVQ